MVAQQPLHLLVASPLSASSFAAGISVLQVRRRLRELPQVVNVASIQYVFDHEYASLRTKFFIDTSDTEATLGFIKSTERLLLEWFEAAGIAEAEVTLSFEKV